MANTWIEALKKWNATKNKGKMYCIPKKGTTEYEQVRAIMNKLNKKK